MKYNQAESTCYSAKGFELCIWVWHLVGLYEWIHIYNPIIPNISLEPPVFLYLQFLFMSFIILFVPFEG